MAEYSDLAYTLAGYNKRQSPYEARRKMGQQMIAQGVDYSPVLHPMQGVARLANALVGAWMTSNADSAEKEAQDARAQEIDRISGIADPQERVSAMSKLDPELGLRIGGQLAVEQAKIQEARRSAGEGAGTIAGLYNMPMPGQGGQPTPLQPMPQQAGSPQEGVGTFESGNNYAAVNPQTGAAGKYQVIPANIGPWTKQYYGQELTPEQFLKNPQAQEAVFQGKFVGEYLPKYGPQGARAAWFAGEGGMRNPNATDANGVSVAQYVQRTGGGQYIPQGSGPQAAPGMPPAPSPQGISGPAIVAPTPTEIPRPLADPEVVQRAYTLRNRGEINGMQMVQMIESDRDRRWQLAQTQAGEDRRTAAQIEGERRREAMRLAADAAKEGMPGKPEMEKYRQAQTDAAVLNRALDDYAKEFPGRKLTDLTGASSPRNTAYYNAALMAKSQALFDLGVLNGPDLDVIRKTLPDPSTFAGQFSSDKSMEAAVAKVRELVNTRLAAKAQALGLSTDTMQLPISGQSGAPGAPRAGGVPPPPPGFRPL